MKTICQKSGVPIWKTDHLLGFDLADEHPIFSAKRKLILNKDMIFRFNDAESEIEKRLIFLAVLNASYLVEFQYPASPSLHTMESNFYRAMELIQWTSFAEYKLAKIVAFPQYVIRRDNADLHNIKSWLQALDEIREKVNKKELERDKNSALLQREVEIKRELGEANFTGKAFTPRLAKWALELCDIGPRHIDYIKWMKAMCCPLNEAWLIQLEDYLELQELLQMNLPMLDSNPQAISVMHQMNTLIKECRKGFTEFSLFDDDSEKNFEFTEHIIDDQGVEHTKTHKINQQYVDVPTTEPKLKDYPSKIAYLVAKAKWDLNNKNKKADEGGMV